MNLDRLTLHNFGVYRGRHVIDLTPPSPKKPVILIGGLNGGGKTTFLDALQLALYGRMAQCSNRGDLAYDEFLRRAVNRGSDPHDGASVEVELSHVSRGNLEALHVRRLWTTREKTVREKLEVCVNGALDPMLADGWPERVEELMPARLSRFFFFDGEKIEALADLDRSADALRTAIHVLLGLDLVDQLVTDLQVIERRKRAERQSDIDRRELEAVEVEVTRLRARRDALGQERQSAQSAVERARKILTEAEERFRLGGGYALENQKRIEAELAEVTGDLERVEEGLREEAEGIAPLLLVTDLLAGIAADDDAEAARAEARMLGKLLAARDAKVLVAAESAGANRKVLKTLTDLFDADRQKREASDEGASYLSLSAEARAILASARTSLGEEVPPRLRRALAHAEVLREKITTLERTQATAPEADRVVELSARRAEAKVELQRAEAAQSAVEAEYERVTRDLENKSARLERLGKKDVDDRRGEEAAKRVVTYAGRMRETMKRFREAILERRIKRLEALVLEGFQGLLRKPSLITGLSIDPRTFAMTLFGADRRSISPERLSAGERQLLAVSIIGALARASGRTLPVVVDTPLGRLDSTHRDRLVERYFPFASHQVILLSTDKEIDRAHYEKLRPYIGRSYMLQHDDKTGVSRIEPGYFF